jgi:hypothetical protein
MARLRGNAAAAAFARISPQNLDKITSGSTWVPTLIASVHDLPIGFTLSNIDLNASDYPLLYVNKYFEKMTGKYRCFPPVFGALI